MGIYRHCEGYRVYSEEISFLGDRWVMSVKVFVGDSDG